MWRQSWRLKVRGGHPRKNRIQAEAGQARRMPGEIRNTRQDAPMDPAVRNEILLIVLAALALILFLCNFGVVGKFGNAVSSVLFGVFGLLAYVAPVIIFLMIAFGMLNVGNRIATRKLLAALSLSFFWAWHSSFSARILRRRKAISSRKFIAAAARGTRAAAYWQALCLICPASFSVR